MFFKSYLETKELISGACYEVPMRAKVCLTCWERKKLFTQFPHEENRHFTNPAHTSRLSPTRTSGKQCKVDAFKSMGTEKVKHAR